MTYEPLLLNSLSHKLLNIGHEQAWLDAGVLHQDISPGNIIIGQNGHAMLVDWDLCKYKEELGQPANRHGRAASSREAIAYVDIS